MEKVINEAILYVKDYFKEDYSGHDFYHVKRVYEIAKTLAIKENADLNIVSLAAILHDVDDRKLSPKTVDNKDNARAFLNKQNVDKQMIERIVSIIDEVSFVGTDSKTPSTIEGKCVQDADRLDAIGAIGIARTFAYGGSHGQEIYNPMIKPNLNMDKESYYANKGTTINHFYEKLFKLEELMNTNSAKELAKERTDYMKEFVDRFLKEWDFKVYE